MGENQADGQHGDDALLRALRAPGTERELAEEDRYRAMFREAGPVPAATPDGTAEPAATPLRSRAPRRLAVAAAGAAALAVTTGGVAAAYTGSLPQPIQTIAHRVIGAPRPSPVPTPDDAGGATRSGGTRGGSAAPAPTGSSSAHPSHRPSHHTDHRPHHRSSASASASASAGASASATPSGTPSASATPSPSPSGTPTAPGPVITNVSITGTSHLADIGGWVSFDAEITTAGDAPPESRRVVLQQHVGHHWAPVAHGTTDKDGDVTLLAPSLQSTSWFRFRAGRVHSATWRVAMHPLLSTTVSATKRAATVTVRVQGGHAGDGVTLLARRNGTMAVVGTGRLGLDGTVAFTLTPSTRTSRYTVVVASTRAHTGAQSVVRVRLGGSYFDLKNRWGG